MPVSDLDLEDRLRRDLRALQDGVPPAPVDLADRTRARHRTLRRRQIGAGATGLVVALVLVGLPIAVPSLLGEGERGQTAQPAETRAGERSLYDLPTRGSLAGDEEWLAAVAARDWYSDRQRLDAESAGMDLPEARVEGRRVAFAGDLPGVRVALVLGWEDRTLVRAWFTGPAGAAADQMQPATAPASTSTDEVAVLWDVPDPAADSGVLVVVAQPDDEVSFLPGVTVTPDGSTTEEWETLPMDDGVAVHRTGKPIGWGFGTQLRVTDGGAPDRPRPLESRIPELSERASTAARAPIDAVDPRGVRGTVLEEWVQSALRDLLATYAVPGDPLVPTLLAAGPIQGRGQETAAVLVGATLPNGATVVSLSTFTRSASPEGGWSGSSTSTRPGPAGTALLDRLLAVPQNGTLTVSGPPSGVVAELVTEEGRTLSTFALRDGIGSSTVPPPPSATVRIKDAAGTVVAEGPFTELAQ